MRKESRRRKSLSLPQVRLKHRNVRRSEPQAATAGAAVRRRNDVISADPPFLFEDSSGMIGPDLPWRPSFVPGLVWLCSLGTEDVGLAQFCGIYGACSLCVLRARWKMDVFGFARSGNPGVGPGFREMRRNHDRSVVPNPFEPIVGSETADMSDSPQSRRTLRMCSIGPVCAAQ